MDEQVTLNCHYISRLLTRPWEGTQCFLRYYDFDTNRFELRSSGSLFAMEDINSPDVESWFKRMVEDPLGSIRRRAAQWGHDQPEDPDRGRFVLDAYSPT